MPYRSRDEGSVCPSYHIFSVVRQRVFFFQNNPKNLDVFQDGSRSLGLFRKGKTRIIAKFHTPI